MMCKRQGHGAQARILVADWDQANANALASVMRTSGFKVATACDGLEAVAEAARFRPDLLVAEPYLGRLSGIHAAAEITRALSDCRVLFLSGEASTDDIAKAAPPELVYSFTSKPIHPLDLLNAIAYLISAEWSTGDPAREGADHNSSNHVSQDQPKPGGSSTLNVNRRQEAEPVSMALDSSTRYLRAMLALKRQHRGRHKRIRHEHAPACS